MARETLAEYAYDSDVERATIGELMDAIIINIEGDADYDGHEEVLEAGRADVGFIERLANGRDVTPRKNIQSTTAAVLDDMGVPYDSDSVAPGSHVSSDTLRAILMALVLEKRRDGYIDDEVDEVERRIAEWAPIADNR